MAKSDEPIPGQEGVVIRAVWEAAQLLQVQEDTIRKWIRERCLIAERDWRTGHWRVHVPLAWVRPDVMDPLRPPHYAIRWLEAAEARHREELLALYRRLEPDGATTLDEDDPQAAATEIIRLINAALDRLNTAVTRSTKSQRYGRPRRIEREDQADSRDNDD